ncbi:serine hydrolase domain-containing protein [Brachybacterium sp. GPGPB12]|uniref:serine hydrolase domain-containing protein n=1 Tax=Brachybacterium sp. GPGPB12 TaxID=3023517 RepID=UPI0031345612
MSALGPLDEFGFEAAAIVLGPEGERERRGDVERIRPWRSVTKTLTGLGAALALQEGRVSLDDEAGPPGATLRHLLAHASGRFYESDATLQAPGLRRHYSNYGIDEAARHVERAVGRDFGDWVQERIADPLGMTGLEWEGSASVGASGALVDLALLAAELAAPHAPGTGGARPARRRPLPGAGGHHAGLRQAGSQPLRARHRGARHQVPALDRDHRQRADLRPLRHARHRLLDRPGGGSRPRRRHLPRLLRRAPRDHAAPRRRRARRAPLTR